MSDPDLAKAVRDLQVGDAHEPERLDSSGFAHGKPAPGMECLCSMEVCERRLCAHPFRGVCWPLTSLRAQDITEEDANYVEFRTAPSETWHPCHFSSDVRALLHTCIACVRARCPPCARRPARWSAHCCAPNSETMSRPFERPTAPPTSSAASAVVRRSGSQTSTRCRFPRATRTSRGCGLRATGMSTVPSSRARWKGKPAKSCGTSSRRFCLRRRGPPPIPPHVRPLHPAADRRSRRQRRRNPKPSSSTTSLSLSLSLSFSLSLSPRYVERMNVNPRSILPAQPRCHLEP